MSVSVEEEFSARFSTIKSAVKRIRVRLEGELGMRLVWRARQDEVTTRWYLTPRATLRHPFPVLCGLCVVSPHLSTATVYYELVLQVAKEELVVPGRPFTISQYPYP